MSGGQSLSNPSDLFLIVASIPTLLPTLGELDAWSKSSIGPSENIISLLGSILFVTLQATSDKFWILTK